MTATALKLFQSPFRAGIKIDAYQLEPLRKALLLPRVNLFIADDVGLGKTIEAGLIARELLLRKKVQDIVVACPPSMLLQWKDELEIRFGLMFKVLDKKYFTSVRQERGFGVNPWSTHSMFLVSHRLLIDVIGTTGLGDAENRSKDILGRVYERLSYAVRQCGGEELGVGFAFVGQQSPLEVGGEEFSIDLLFDHCRLHCDFVIDLKMRSFEPEHAGKMSYYLSAVDDLLRDPAVDQPTLGSSLCRDKNRLVAEYALRDNHKPIGVAGWETKLVESLPKNLRGSLPTIEELEAELFREPAPLKPPKRRRRTDAGTTRQPAALWGRVDLAESAKREAAIRENLIGLGFGWPNG